MAPRKTTPTTSEITPAAPSSTGLTLLAVVEADAVPRKSASSEPNPLRDIWQDAVDTNTAKAIVVGSTADVEKAVLFLQRLAREPEYAHLGLSKSAQDNGDDTFTVTFKPTQTRRTRKYGRDELVAFAAGLDITIADGQKVPVEIRNAYRIHAGLETEAQQAKRLARTVK